MDKKSQASVSESLLLALLDDDERAALYCRIGLQSASDQTLETHLPIGQLVSEIVHLRQPFIRMMRDIGILLQHLEASIRGNVRFIVLPNLDKDLRLDFSQQIRNSIATALNQKFLANHREIIRLRTEELEKGIRSICNRIVATRIRRRTKIGEALDKLADIHDEVNPHLASEYRYLADKVPELSDKSMEFNSADRELLQQIGRQLSDVNNLVSRLQPRSKQLVESIPDFLSLLERATRTIQVKLQTSRRVSRQPPFAHRKASVKDGSIASNNIRLLREAILAACDYCESIDELYDFLNLEIWKQRWRVYELWVLSHLVLQLVNSGAKVSDRTRIHNGIWRLKFTKDTAPILSLDCDRHFVDIYYQFYQSRDGTGDMPDIAVRLREGPFIAVIDPKHGKSYSRNDLNEVCRRYSEAFTPSLSCIVNYFAVRDSEQLNAVPKSLVLYGMFPEAEMTRRFDDAIADAMDTCWQRQGFGLFWPVTLIVLIDGSTSTEQCREDLLRRFDSMLSELGRPIRPQSLALVFGDLLLSEGSIAQLSSRELVQNLPSSGTDLSKAVQSIRFRLPQLPLPSELWIFTDGEIGDVSLLEEIKGMASRLRIVESTNETASSLREFCERIGGHYSRLEG